MGGGELRGREGPLLPANAGAARPSTPWAPGGCWGELPGRAQPPGTCEPNPLRNHRPNESTFSSAQGVRETCGFGASAPAQESMRQRRHRGAGWGSRALSCPHLRGPQPNPY